jgi:hypothetical protein
MCTDATPILGLKLWNKKNNLHMLKYVKSLEYNRKDKTHWLKGIHEIMLGKKRMRVGMTNSCKI